MTVIAPYAKEHANPQSAGDARPTALQIVKDQNLIGKLSGKVAFVTGCSPRGLGVETARAFHAAGADVYIQVRDASKGKESADDIKSDKGAGKVEVIEMELDSFDSIRKGAADFLGRSKTLNILVNNAGVMACPESTTKDGYEMQFGTNHLGHFLLFQLLKPTLLASSTPNFNSKVISLSSTGHRITGIQFDDYNFKKQGYSPWAGYGQSKTANIYFANELDRRYRDKGLRAFSLHPGGIFTPLQRHLSADFMKVADEPLNKSRMKSTEQGAATSVWAALAKELDGRGGLYLEDCQISALTDPDDQSATKPGYAPHCYDEQAEKRLWTESLQMVGMDEDT